MHAHSSQHALSEVAAALRTTQDLLDAHPARIAGTPGCLSAARDIAERMRGFCDRVEEERFDQHPGSMWNVGRVMAGAYLLAALCWITAGALAYAAPLISLLGLVYGATHYVYCGRLFDRLYVKEPGCNVVGVIEPDGEANRQIIVSGHHDSPYVFSFLLHAQPLAGARLILAMVFYTMLTVFCVVGAVQRALGTAVGLPSGIPLALALLGMAFVAPLFWLIQRRSSPGAGDNLLASAIAVEVGAHLAQRRREGHPLKHTRILLLSNDGEEAGQRGAIAFAERHKEDLWSLPTVVLNIDSVYKRKDLAALTRDRNGTMPLSADLAAECREIARTQGVSLQTKPLPVGGGTTDAAAFANIGVAATTLIGIPTDLVSRGLVYHTPYDTVDRIEPAAVEAVVGIIAGYISRHDETRS